MKIALRLIIIAAIFLIPTGCGDQITSQQGEKDILAGLESTLPENWYYTEIFAIDTSYIPMGMTTPEHVFRIYKDVQSDPKDISMLLFFYPVAQQTVIDSIIHEQAIGSWCIPMTFAKSNEHYVITSPCNIHSSSDFETGTEVESVIDIVKEFIANKGS